MNLSTMKFRNSLYTVTDQQNTGDAARYTIVLNAEHVIYKAHFPGMPITPGVCLLQIARELMEDHSGQPLEITMVKNVKFLSVISPVELPEITCSLSHISMAESGVECRAQISSTQDKQVLAKLSFKCKKRDG